MTVRHGLGRTHNEAPMLHALGADEPIGQLLHLSRFAAKDNHFQATLMVEMCVQRGNDDLVIVVLEIGQLLR